jgi:hypothetical protein
MFSINRGDLESWFLDSAPGKKMLADRRKTYLSEREELVGQLDELAAEAAIAIPAATAKADAALTECKKAEALFQKAAGVANRSAADAFGLSQSFTSRRQRIEQQLRESADPVLDDFLREMRDLAERERHTEVQKEEVCKGWRGMLYYETSASTYASLIRRMQSIGDVIRSAEQLKLSSCADVPTKLQQLRDDLPGLVMEPVDGSGRREWDTMGRLGTHPARTS